MNRLLLLALFLLLLPSVSAGCRSCHGANDYCGPLPDEPCDFLYRRNSILGGDSRPEARAASALETEPQQPAAGEENLPTPAGQPVDEAAPIPIPPEAGASFQPDPYAIGELAEAPQARSARLPPEQPVLRTARGPMFGPPQR